MYTFIAFCLNIIFCINFVVNSEVCRQDNNCRLPECNCGGRQTPGRLKPAEIPQMILFSFDDAVTEEINIMFRRLFPPGRLNPNGCPIPMTMFLSHNFTDYNVVRDLYKRGMEIAVHSVTHRTPTTFWKMAPWDDLKYEIVQQRKITSENTGIPIANITGWRSPFLQPSGDQQYTLLRQENFEYDSTLTVAMSSGNSSKLWPSTLDFGWNLDCNVKPCPKGKHPGLWEIPIQMLEKPSSSSGCLYVDSCRPDNLEDAFQLFWMNFDRHYTTTRTPLFFTLHPAWLREEHNLRAMDHFILTLLHYYQDVYFLTYQQLLAWMRNPTKTTDIKSFQPWLCSWNNQNGGKFVQGTLQDGGNSGVRIYSKLSIIVLIIALIQIFLVSLN